MITIPPLHRLIRHFNDCSDQSMDLLCDVRSGMQELEALSAGSGSEAADCLLARLCRSAEMMEEVHEVLRATAEYLQRTQEAYDEVENAVISQLCDSPLPKPQVHPRTHSWRCSCGQMISSRPCPHCGQE